MRSKVGAWNSKTDPKEYFVGVNVQLNNVCSSSRHEQELCPCHRSHRRICQHKSTHETCTSTGWSKKALCTWWLYCNRQVHRDFVITLYIKKRENFESLTFFLTKIFLKLLCLIFITQSVHYKTVSTTYVVDRKILHSLVCILQSNIPMNILQSHVHISVKWHSRKSGC